MNLTVYAITTVTRKYSKNRTVSAVITILFGHNVAGGFYLWEDIHRLIGTKEESRSGVLSAELKAFTGPNSALVEIIFSGLPVILADGLLVRYLFYNFGRFSHSVRVDMAMLQNMESLASSYRTVVNPPCC